jgi:hypothetical protein
MALNRPRTMSAIRSLSGEQRTHSGHRRNDVDDPERTWSVPDRAVVRSYSEALPKHWPEPVRCCVYPWGTR